MLLEQKTVENSSCIHVLIFHRYRLLRQACYWLKPHMRTVFVRNISLYNVPISMYLPKKGIYSLSGKASTLYAHKKFDQLCTVVHQHPEEIKYTGEPEHYT